jgi:hypothetical protein
MSKRVNLLRTEQDAIEKAGSGVGDAMMNFIAEDGVDRTTLNPEMDQLEKLSLAVREFGKIAGIIADEHQVEKLIEATEKAAAVLLLWRASLQ